ncbi:unnamed protein product, partial [Aureobasidium mustum]
MRDQLIAAQNNHALPQPQQPQHHAQPTNSYPAHQSHQQPQHHHHHDPVMAIQPYGMTHDSPDLSHPHADPADANAQGPAAGKKGRAQRELSNTKRAAQNRAAQRAFRLRKEQHINKLEDDLKQYLVMEENFKTLQHENLALRNYISLLQSKMTDQNIEFPPAPEQGPMRSASISDNQPLHQHQEQEPVYQPVPDQQPAQHDQHSHGPSPNVYPQSTPDQHHHQHEPPANAQPTHHEPPISSRPLPLKQVVSIVHVLHLKHSMIIISNLILRTLNTCAPVSILLTNVLDLIHLHIRRNAFGDSPDGFVDLTHLNQKSESSINFDELFGEDVPDEGCGIGLPSGALAINDQCESLANWDF